MPRTSTLGYHFAIGDGGLVSFELTGRTKCYIDGYSICNGHWSIKLSACRGSMTLRCPSIDLSTLTESLTDSDTVTHSVTVIICQ